MDYSKDTQVFFLKDLCFFALRHWRIIVVAMVLFALVLGFGLGTKTPPIDNATYQLQLEAFEKESASLEADLENCRKNLSYYKNHMENSLLQRLNPYGVYEATLSIYVSTNKQAQSGKTQETSDLSKDILQNYVLEMNSGDVLDALSQAVGTHTEYLREVYSVTTLEDANIAIATVQYYDQDGAQLLVAKLQELLKAKSADIQTNIAPHTMQIIDASVGLLVRLDLLEKQQASLDSLASYQSKVDEQELNLKHFLNTKPASPVVSFGINSILKYAFVGAVLAAVLTVAFLWIYYLASTKVYSAKILSLRTGIKVLTCMQIAPAKCFIDRWLKRLEGRDTRCPQEAMAVTVADLQHRCKEVRHLVLAGEAKANEKKQVTAALQAVLPNTVIADVGSLKSVAGIEALNCADAVLFVEKCNLSHYPSVTGQLAFAADYGKPVLGCILIDG